MGTPRFLSRFAVSPATHRARTLTLRTVSKIAMTSLALVDAGPRSPGARDMVPPVVVAPLVAAAAFGVLWQSSTVALAAAIGGAAAAFLVAWPLLFWMIDNGRETARVRTAVGAICGVTPFAGALASGVLGLYVRSGDLKYVSRVLEHGAAVPYYGAIPWLRFGLMAALGIVCGILTLWMSRAASR